MFVLVRMVVVGLVVVLALVFAWTMVLSVMQVLVLSLALVADLKGKTLADSEGEILVDLEGKTLAPRRLTIFTGACRFSLRRSQGKQSRLMFKAAIPFGQQRRRLRARQACLRSWCV